MKPTILENIIQQKMIEVAEISMPISMESKVGNVRKKTLFESFKENKNMNIIAEIKRASPSKGDINRDVNVVDQAKVYVENGASAISVLTDKKYFNGSLDDLVKVSKAVHVPILCKDFIIDRRQIDLAKNAGADVILLIVAALPKARIKNLFHYAKLHGLEVLVEVHNEEELITAMEIGAKIIGVNNRNLHTFEVDLSVTERLSKLINNQDLLLISESGIKVKEDVERVASAGAEGILVGETLMMADNVMKKMTELQVMKGSM
jgi:indole-3-glycerol phosphate synthase